MASGTQLLLPLLLFSAAAVVFVAPERGTAVVLFLLAVLTSPFGIEVLAPQHMSDILCKAMTDALPRAIINKDVKRTLKEVLVDAVEDENMQKSLASTLSVAVISAMGEPKMRSAVVDTAKDVLTIPFKDETFIVEVGHAAKAASKNKDLQDACLEISKEAVSDGLNGAPFMAGMLKIFTQSTIQASKDKQLQGALMNVTKEAVTDALMDEGFMVAFGDAMCKGLMDCNIYRSAAKGVVNSLNPFASRPTPSYASRIRTASDENFEPEIEASSPETGARIRSNRSSEENLQGNHKGENGPTHTAALAE